MIKIYQYGQVAREDVFARGTAAADVSGKVSEIIADVRRRGDEALLEYAAKFDKAQLTSLEVSSQEIEAAFASVEPRFLEVLERAAANIRAYHEQQLRKGFELRQENGVILGQKVLPIEKVGLCVPGGTAAYPSSVLMAAIPAKIAGCKEICITSAPSCGGTINPVVLAAAKIAGVDRIFKVGGAQAIAALAYGTETIPAVDKILGPGGAMVAEAKKQVFGRVAIDMIAGPSEILIVSDSKSNPRYVAADMLSQAEHDVNASAVLVTDSMDLAEAVALELERQLSLLPRQEIARASIENNGKIIVADDLMQAVDISNEIAPEHLELCVEEPFAWLDAIRHAGSVFLGRYCPEALGDYMAGPNHTLPTMGTARFANPLSVDDFVKKTQYTYYTRDALAKVAEDIAYFAGKEGLDAHGRSAQIRFEEEI